MRKIILAIALSVMAFLPITLSDARPARRVRAKSSSVASYKAKVVSIQKQLKPHFDGLVAAMNATNSSREYYGGLQEELSSRGLNPSIIEEYARKEDALTGGDKWWLEKVAVTRPIVKKLRSLSPVPRSLKKADDILITISQDFDDALDSIKAWRYTGSYRYMQDADNSLTRFGEGWAKAFDILNAQSSSSRKTYVR